MPNINFQIPGILPEIQDFLQDLIVEAGLGQTDPALKASMLTDLSERLNAQLALTLAKHLNEAQLETFSRLAAVDGAQAAAFLKDINPEFPKLLLDALAEFRQVFLKA